AARAASPWPAPDPLTDVPDLQVGQPCTFDFLFCRDLVGEHTHPDHYVGAQSVPPPTPDKLIKSMINFELHGLMDCAVDIAEHFRPVLAPRLDVDVAIKLLLRRPPQTRYNPEIANALGMIDELRREVGRSLTRAHARATRRREDGGRRRPRPRREVVPGPLPPKGPRGENRGARAAAIRRQKPPPRRPRPPRRSPTAGRGSRSPGGPDRPAPPLGP